MATKPTTKKTTTKKTAEKTTAKKTTAKSTAAKTTTRKPRTKAKQITESDIRKKAQEIYDKRVLKGIPGDEVSDWLKAEDELKKN